MKCIIYHSENNYLEHEIIVLLVCLLYIDYSAIRLVG